MRVYSTREGLVGLMLVKWMVVRFPVRERLATLQRAAVQTDAGGRRIRMEDFDR